MSTHFEQDELTRQIAGALEPLIEDRKGSLDVASTPEHSYELLQVKPRGWRVVMGWEGWEPNEGARESYVDDRYYFFIQIPKGMSIRPGKKVHQARPGTDDNMMDLIQVLDAWVRAMRFGGGGIDKAGMVPDGGEWVAIETERGGLIEATQFRLAYRLPRLLPLSDEVGAGMVPVERESAD